MSSSSCSGNPTDSPSLSSCPTSISPVSRSETVWFHDGNLVIEAGGTHFRVYRGLIAKHSPIFRDMLSMPQSPDQRLIDGYPVVQLHDTAEDVTYFLSALYDSSFFERTLDIEFAVIAGVLRLSVKYDVRYLRRRVVAQILLDYPDNLSTYDRQEERVLIETPYLAFKILDLALSTNISPEMLPAVYYDVVTQEKFVEGILWASEHCECLTSEQLCALHASREALRKATIMRLHKFCHDHGCAYSSCILAGHMGKRNSVMEWAEWRPFSLEIPWETLGALHSDCLNRARKIFDKSREQLWEDLPGFFNLPEWSAMKDPDLSEDEDEGEGEGEDEDEE